MTFSADVVLLEAAQLMRERARLVEPSAVPGSDWWSYNPGVNPRAIMRADVDDAIASTPDIAEFIASWSPGVALAVADWLEVTAKDVGSSSLAHHTAVAVAHTYLGDQTP